MKEESLVRFDEGMSFAIDVEGHQLHVDAAPEHGGQNRGLRPKQLLLSALGGCTGMDVVSILRKKRMAWESLSMRISGEVAEEHPKVFTQIKIVYSFAGNELDEEKIKRAVKLSFEKYCAVNAMLKKAADVRYEIELNP